MLKIKKIDLNGINSKYFFILVERENWKRELTAETVGGIVRRKLKAFVSVSWSEMNLQHLKCAPLYICSPKLWYQMEEIMQVLKNWGSEMIMRMRSTSSQFRCSERVLSGYFVQFGVFVHPDDYDIYEWMDGKHQPWSKDFVMMNYCKPVWSYLVTPQMRQGRSINLSFWPSNWPLNKAPLLEKRKIPSEWIAPHIKRKKTPQKVVLRRAG